jgi:hypothetical protein
MAKTVFDVLNEKIDSLKESNTAALVGGSAKDFAAYREIVGVIRGLTFAQRELQDLAQAYKDDDDE